VLDRTRLEQRVCECYAVVKKEFSRLLPYLQRPADGAVVAAPSRLVYARGEPDVYQPAHRALNRLLAALPRRESQRLLAAAKRSS